MILVAATRFFRIAKEIDRNEIASNSGSQFDLVLDHAKRSLIKIAHLRRRLVPLIASNSADESGHSWGVLAAAHRYEADGALNRRIDQWPPNAVGMGH